jgi:uncharacterized membrane protein
MSKGRRINQKQSRSSKVGFLMAGASAPRSFQRSLMERDNVDQGIVTGLSMSLAYAIGALAQDGLELIADKITKNGEVNDGKKKNESFRDNSDDVSFWLSAGAIGFGLATQYIFQQRKDESMVNASIRTSGHILSRVGLAGVTAQALEKGANKITNGKSERESELVYSMIVPTGAVIAVLMDRIIYHNQLDSDEGNADVNKLKSAGIGFGVVSLLAITSLLERKTAQGINYTLNKYAPSLNKSWLPIGHLASLGILVSGITFGIKKLYGNIENGADKIEDSFRRRPITEFVSGSKDSFVDWDTLSVQGRRHIGTRLSANQISKVLKNTETKVKEPIRIYVGLDSAPTESERVKLALEELDRTNAYSRKNIIIISPTGTGYVNYVMGDAVEYMSNGDCAQVTLQYSKRPSPLSLDRRDEGHIQYRMLINGIKKQVAQMPKSKRPKLIMFGESLGAWTSQDAFMYEGTDGFEASLIDKALWIGTPAESKWKDRALSNKSLNTEKDLIGVFNGFDEYEELTNEQQKKLRYFMVSHYNDPVARFTTSLLVQAPDWLRMDDKRPPTIPKSVLFRVPGTFVQTLVDMKNALKPIPGQFVATGHDYRGDLAPFIRVLVDAKITDKQFDDILSALKNNDKLRAKKSV